MNIDAGEEAGELREDARRQTQPATPEPVGDAVKPHGPEARIAEQDLKPRARSRVALQDGVDVFANACEHAKSL